MDSREFGTKVFWVVVAVCGISVFADLFYEKHGHYDIEHWVGFHGFYGFVSCVALVVAAKWLRDFLMRDEDYYD